MTLTHWPKSHEPKNPQGRWETFAEMVENMDQQVGRLVECLDQLELRDETLVLFTADNGSPTNVTSKLGDRAVRGGKAKLTDAGTRVPLIACWPGTSLAGSKNADLIDFSDFLPTFADLAGVQLPTDRIIDGRSFAPQLKGEIAKPRQWVFTEWSGQRWVRDKRWKLYDDGRLYDMQVDESEKKPIKAMADVADSQAARTNLANFLRQLLDSKKEQGDP
jgi:arylsulfatase A